MGKAVSEGMSRIWGAKCPKKILRKICVILHNMVFLLNTASEIFFNAFAVIFANSQRLRYFILQKGKKSP